MPLFSPHGLPGRITDEKPENNTQSMENIKKPLQQKYYV